LANPVGFERMWLGLKIAFATLAKMSNVGEGFAEQALKLMAKIEDDEKKLEEKEHG